MMSARMTLVSTIYMFTAFYPIADAGRASGDDDAFIKEFLLFVDDTMPAARIDVEEHFSQIKEVLTPIIQASPKNKYGRLDDSAARYALYRLFMERHGWVMKSFGDSAGEVQGVDLPSLFSFGDSFPEPIQKLLEDQVDGRGSNIVELSLFGAMMEYLIKDETIRGLGSIYDLKRFPTNHPVGKWQAESLIDLYMACYISGRDVFNLSVQDAYDVQQSMADAYHNWKGTQKYFRDMMEAHAPGHTTYTFKEVSNIVVATVNNFVYWNNQQCSSYKSKLMEIEENDSGRVRLLEFYRSAVRENGTSTFLETEEYLRNLGALEEADPLAPSVLISNYLDGPSNCVARTSHYSVCCMDECADLYSHLENALGKPAARPAEIIPVVEGLNSASMLQCRDKLPRMLRTRLEDIASRNGGLVELHGTDFAEWMHFAYPRECSNVKKFGPAHFMTIEEWMVESETMPQASDDDILGSVKRLEGFQIAFKRQHLATVQGVSDEESRKASEAWSSFTWSLLFCVLSMMVLTWKLHQDKEKEAASAFATSAEKKLIDWSAIV